MSGGKGFMFFWLNVDLTEEGEGRVSEGVGGGGRE